MNLDTLADVFGYLLVVPTVVRELILPADNRGDYQEVPEHFRKGIKVHFACTFPEVAGVIFRRKRAKRR